MSRWWIFTRERFEPLSHGLMIGVFFAAHLAMAGWPPLLIREKIILLIGVIAFFFKLRLYDEIKDYETDLRVNPTRPLARGLVSHRDLFQGILACIVVENVAFVSFGISSWVTYLVALVYSGLMFKEFFIPSLIRPHLTTYAVSHTFVSVLVSLSIFSALRHQCGCELGTPLYLAALSSWCVFNIFEFARKTFAPSEERPTVDSYSKVFGAWGAGLLVVVMAGLAWFLLVRVIPNAQLQWIQGGLVTLIAVAAILSAWFQTPKWTKTYRTMGSLYIVAFYLSIIFASGVV